MPAMCTVENVFVALCMKSFSVVLLVPLHMVVQLYELCVVTASFEDFLFFMCIQVTCFFDVRQVDRPCCMEN